MIMKTISAAICDDLPEERTLLARMVHASLEARGCKPVIRLFSSGDELVGAFRPGLFHIVFLDIYMPGISGVDAARTIRAKDAGVAIIFATTSEEHGLESYDVRASDYLVKPFKREDVDAALDWCLSRVPDALRTISISSNWEPMEIPLRSIRYIEVLDHQSHIHTDKDVIVTRRGLDELESLIGSDDFLRCHRSYLVNMYSITGIKGSDFCMQGGDLVPISSANLSAVRSKFIDWTYRQAWGKA